jgi:hypothetical protein
MGGPRAGVNTSSIMSYDDGNLFIRGTPSKENRNKEDTEKRTKRIFIKRRESFFFSSVYQNIYYNIYFYLYYLLLYTTTNKTIMDGWMDCNVVKV